MCMDIDSHPIKARASSQSSVLEWQLVYCQFADKNTFTDKNTGWLSKYKVCQVTVTNILSIPIRMLNVCMDINSHPLKARVSSQSCVLEGWLIYCLFSDKSWYNPWSLFNIRWVYQIYVSQTIFIPVCTLSTCNLLPVTCDLLPVTCNLRFEVFE